LKYCKRNKKKKIFFRLVTFQWWSIFILEYYSSISLWSHDSKVWTEVRVFWFSDI